MGNVFMCPSKECRPHAGSLKMLHDRGFEGHCGGLRPDKRHVACSPSQPSGSFGMGLGPRACLARCVACHACTFVTFGVMDGACSWHSTCTQLVAREPRHDIFPPYVTWRVRAPNGTVTEPSEFGSDWRVEAGAAEQRWGEGRPGYCAQTLRTGSCTADDRGTWSLRTLAECRAACLGCPRCRYVSFEPSARDCSWYASCDLDDLRRSPRVQPDYTTVAVRPDATLPPPPASQLARDANGDGSSGSSGSSEGSGVQQRGGAAVRITIATLSVGPYLTGLAQWCESATRLKQALPPSWRVQLAILGGKARIDPWKLLEGHAKGQTAGGGGGGNREGLGSEPRLTKEVDAAGDRAEFRRICPRARVVSLQRRMLEAAATSCARNSRCVGKLPHTRCHGTPQRGFGGCFVNLLKWQLVRIAC